MSGGFDTGFVMEQLARLAGGLMSQAVGTLASGGAVVPTIALERAGGRELQHFSDQDLMQAVKDARDALRQKVLTATRAALLLGGIEIPSDGDQPALVVEAAEFGDPLRELQVVLPYQPLSTGAFARGEPIFTFPEGMSPSERQACIAAFRVGIEDDAGGARVWGLPVPARR